MSEPHYETAKRRGIATAAGYDAYFTFFTPPHAVPKASIDRAAHNFDDFEVQLDLLREFIAKRDEDGAPLIGEYLRELQYRFIGANAAQPTQALLDALFEVGEDIQSLERAGGLFSVPPWVWLTGLIDEMLTRWGPSEAGEALNVAFARARSVSLRSSMFVRCARDLGQMPSDRAGENRITLEGLHVLGTHLLPAIREAVADGSLERSAVYYDIVRAWAYLAGNDEPRAWISEGAKSSAEFLSKLALGLLSHSVSAEGRAYFLRERPDPAFYDLSALQSACEEHRKSEQLSSEQRARLEALHSGLAKLGRGERLDDESYEHS
jgi:hypothetical protein